MQSLADDLLRKRKEVKDDTGVKAKIDNIVLPDYSKESEGDIHYNVRSSDNNFLC
jgi:hypothetical protein